MRRRALTGEISFPQLRGVEALIVNGHIDVCGDMGERASAGPWGSPKGQVACHDDQMPAEVKPELIYDP